MAIQLVVASPEPSFHEFVREQLAHIPNALVVGEYEEIGPNLYVRMMHDLTAHPQTAVLLDISLDPEQGLHMLEQLTQAAPGLYAILSDSQCTPEFLLRSMRLGSSDFLQQPLKRVEFRDAMERPLGKMYTFVGAKGGVGTTTAAVNFAAILARQNKSTVLLDLDLDSGDAASYLGLRHPYSLADVAENLGQMDQAMLEGIVARDPLGFAVLCAPGEIEKARLISEQHLREVIALLIELYDAVVVDGGSGLDNLLLTCLELSDSIFLLLTPEFPAVRNAQHYLTALAQVGFGHEAIKLVVNRYDKRSSLYVRMEQLQQTLGAPPFWALPNRYEEAMQAVHEARPVVVRGATELGRAYRAFAKKLGLDSQPAAETQPAAAQRK